MIAPTITDRLADFRRQVDRFRLDVEQATARLDAMTDRDPRRFLTVADHPTSIRAAIANLDRAEAGLRNAERLLREHESPPDRRVDRPP